MSVCLLAEYIKKLWVDLHEVWGMGKLWTTEELTELWKSSSTYSGYFIVKLTDVKVKLGKPLTTEYGKI